MSELKYEVGKHYRLRNGNKVLMLYINPGNGRLLVLRLPDKHVFWLCQNGFYLDSEEWDVRDIVSEWQEPRQWTVYIYEREGKTCVPLFVGPAHVAANMTLLARVPATEGEGLK